MSKPVDPADLDFILNKLAELSRPLDFRNEKILLTGGTGFFGKWMTQTLIAMNDRWSLGNQICVLSRDPAAALISSPWLAGRSDVRLIAGDVRVVKFDSDFTTIIHGAAAASRALNEQHPDEMYDTILEGTINVVAQAGACRRFQLVSSGAVYGRQPLDVSHISESAVCAPDPASAYGRAKLEAEQMVTAKFGARGAVLSIPRCFAFIGPYLPLDLHFAAGNFLRNILYDEVIEIQGDGTPLRSYLYAADLVVWQLTALLSDKSTGVFNLGSDSEVSIEELAKLIDRVGRAVRPARGLLGESVVVKGKAISGKKPERYVPMVAEAKRRLRLEPWTPLSRAIEITLKWYIS